MKSRAAQRDPARRDARAELVASSALHALHEPQREHALQRPVSQAIRAVTDSVSIHASDAKWHRHHGRVRASPLARGDRHVVAHQPQVQAITVGFGPWIKPTRQAVRWLSTYVADDSFVLSERPAASFACGNQRDFRLHTCVEHTAHWRRCGRTKVSMRGAHAAPAFEADAARIRGAVLVEATIFGALGTRAERDARLVRSARRRARLLADALVGAHFRCAIAQRDTATARAVAMLCAPLCTRVGH